VDKAYRNGIGDGEGEKSRPASYWLSETNKKATINNFLLSLLNLLIYFNRISCTNIPILGPIPLLHHPTYVILFISAIRVVLDTTYIIRCWSDSGGVVRVSRGVERASRVVGREDLEQQLPVVPGALFRDGVLQSLPVQLPVAALHRQQVRLQYDKAPPHGSISLLRKIHR